MSTNQTSEMSTSKMNEIVEKYNKIKDRERRQTAKTRILVRKARLAGIVVTDKEVDDYLKENK